MSVGYFDDIDDIDGVSGIRYQGEHVSLFERHSLALFGLNFFKNRNIHVTRRGLRSGRDRLL